MVSASNPRSTRCRLGLKNRCSFWYALRYAKRSHLRAQHERTGRLYVWSLSEQLRQETVSIYVPCNHPLLRLKRALPWDALAAVMEHHWRQAGKNIDRRPGLPWDVALYVPLVVLMLVKHLNAREMEAYVSENVVARIFIGRQDDPTPQLRDRSTSPGPMRPWARWCGEINAVILHVAQDCGFADTRILSSDTTAQELPIGYPNEPGILRGGAKRCGRALAKLKAARWWGSSQRWRRCRQSSGRSKNTICLREARPSARC